MVVLELQYLHEVGRINYGGDHIAAFLDEQLSVAIDRDGLANAVLHATGMRWTRDPFDRVITAHASSLGAHLLTRDSTIRRHYPAAVW